MNVINVYDEYIDKKNDELKEERYEDYEDWFHGSGAGLCARKHYFKNIEKVKGEPKSKDLMRLFRLGNIVHDDIQAAVSEVAIDDKTTIYIEHEVIIPEFNVRSFLDMVIVEDNELYEVKTANSWSIAKINKKGPPIHHYLQTGTYGYWYEQKSGKPLGKLALLYYNKNNSEMREIAVSRDYIRRAETYWKKLKNELKWGLPKIKLGLAPYRAWECGYCEFYTHCGGGLDK